MKRPRNWKQLLFLLWVLCTFAWINVASHKTDLRTAMMVYKSYQYTTNSLQTGRGTDYQRYMFRNYSDRLEWADRRFAIFFFIGIGIPGMILAGGTWLLRTENKTRTPTRK